MDLKRKLSGRMRRKNFLHFCLFSVFSMLVLLAFQRVTILVYPNDQRSLTAALLDVSNVIVAFGAILLGAAIVLVNVVFTVRRLHDFGYSGLWAIGVVALSALSLMSATFSILQILAQILLVSVPGNRGTNQYGPDPRQT